MQKYLLPLILLVVGVIVIDQGRRRADSLVGRSETIGKDVANAVDGRMRQPEHVYYYAVGGVLILVGAGLAMRRRRS